MDDIEVVGAVVERAGMVLCARRGPHGSQPGLWEFPGGKVEPGESPQEALVREIDEELGCLVSVEERIVTAAHRYDLGTVTLTTYRCSLIEGEPIATEHDRLQWLAPDDLGSLVWAPADLPTVERLRTHGPADPRLSTGGAEASP